MIPNIEIIGLIAAALTTSSFVPQVYKTWKTKEVENLSLTMYLVFFIGVFLWFIYGFYLNSLSMIIANMITLFLVLFLIVLKLKYSEK